MNWAGLGSIPSDVQAPHPRRGHRRAARRALAAGHFCTRRNALERQPAHVIDEMPTLIDVAGAKYPRAIKGQAIRAMEGDEPAPAFAGQSLRRTQPLFWEHENRAVRAGNWKLVSTYPDDWELCRAGPLRRAQQPCSAASRHREPSGRRMECLAGAGPRGLLARAAPAALGRRCTSRRPWPTRLEPIHKRRTTLNAPTAMVHDEHDDAMNTKNTL